MIRPTPLPPLPPNPPHKPLFFEKAKAKISDMKNLIPDLPEEIGMECLIRVPHQTLPLLRQVCRRWKEATESPLFHHLRHSAGSYHRLIIFSQAHPAPSAAAESSVKYSTSLPSFRLAALHQSSGEWAPLPPIPFFPRGLPLFCGLAASGLHLVVIGGWDPYTFTPSDAVYIYSFLSATWRRGAPMPGPTRSFFACAASPSNQVFVAGGHDDEKNALKSAMVYDISKDKWTILPEMAKERDECTGVFDANKAGLFLVVGGYCTSMQGRFVRSAETFDIGEWRWRAVVEEAVPEGECSKTCVVGGDGRIYICAGGGKVVVVKEGEEWREVAELPEDVRLAPKMVAWGGGLMVVGSGCSGGALVAYALEMKQGAATGWLRVEIPKEYSGYVLSACCIDI